MKLLYYGVGLTQFIAVIFLMHRNTDMNNINKHLLQGELFFLEFL